MYFSACVCLGSGVVHLVGGTAGLVGTFLLGPRIGRFEANKEGKFEGKFITVCACMYIS